MIRKAIKDDIPRLLELCIKQYLAEHAHEYGINLNVLPLKNALKSFIDNPALGHIHVCEDDGIKGFIIGQITFNITDLMQPICHEVGLYVEPEARGKKIASWLKHAMEKESAKKGVTLQSMGRAVADKDTEFLHEKYIEWGYTPFQTIYFKQLQHGENEE